MLIRKPFELYHWQIDIMNLDNYIIYLGNLIQRKLRNIFEYLINWQFNILNLSIILITILTFLYLYELIPLDFAANIISFMLIMIISIKLLLKHSYNYTIKYIYTYYFKKK